MVGPIADGRVWFYFFHATTPRHKMKTRTQPAPAKAGEG
jgi:hypothetical protein